MVISPEVLSLFQIVGFILDILSIHKESRIDLPMSVKNSVGILMGIGLNLHISFGKIAIFTMLILPFHEHGGFSEVFFNFFSQGCEVLSYRSFTCLVRVTPRYLLLFVSIVKNVASLISFISFPGSLSFV